MTVADLPRSIAFYRDVVELELAYELPERGAAFFWVGGRGQGLLGLWSLGSAPLGMSLHIAFRVPLDDASDAERGIVSWSQWTAAEF
ncbi:MAG TPA: VOC family protein [Solirubrobacter sp.]